LSQDLFISTQMVRCNRAMNRLAIDTAVLCRNVDCNQLTFGRRQCIESTKKDIRRPGSMRIHSH
jgi:hypothetical protein